MTQSEGSHAQAKAILRLHHDESVTFSCAVHGYYGQPVERVFQHKNKVIAGFTSRYNLTRLVYYECFVYPDAAIAREKEIKG